ncbi:hypothetical protein GCM10009819_15840 [Agromyces tropicus]|uniref:Uncharacterized protein n=1 Tax=Agromyces tropicus TaxID=555371 RepID=A0ABN2U9K9_9MICO
MRTNRITDDVAEALLRGHSPRARGELSPLADAVVAFRAESSSGMPPRPSTAVASRLDPDLVSTVGSAPRQDPDTTAALARTSSVRRRRVMEWFAGLGLATKIAMGAAAAVAVGATGAGAAGAVGVLPEPAQVVFDQMAGTESEVAGDSSPTDDATGDEAVTGLENAEEKAGSGLETAVEHADEHAEFGLETAEEHAGSGIGMGEEASDGAGAPEGAGDQADDAGSHAGDAGSQAGDRPASGGDD